MSAKLVRSKVGTIPLQFERVKDGFRPVRDEAEHLKLLRRKILEESTELYDAIGVDEIEEESADLLEAVMTYVVLAGGSLDRVERMAEDKRHERGGFSPGLVWEYGQE